MKTTNSYIFIQDIDFKLMYETVYRFSRETRKNVLKRKNGHSPTRMIYFQSNDIRIRIYIYKNYNNVYYHISGNVI